MLPTEKLKKKLLRLRSNLIRVFLISLITVSASAAEVEGISQPSADVALSFVRPGKVVKVNVKDGDKVSKDQLIAQIDSELEYSQIAQLKAELENDVKIRAEKAKITQKKKDLVDLEKAVKQGAGTQKEVDTVKLEILQMEFNVENFEFEKLQIKKKIEEKQITAEQSNLETPIDGLVERVEIEVGESVERLKEVFRIVKINPLWIDVNIPLENTATLNVGSELFIRFPSMGSKDSVTKKAKIIFRSSVADPGSETLNFRLEVENPEFRLAGERVKVLVPDKK